ncbi:HK97 family phage prohead protease [Micromonospora sp. NPDC049580]|uniref:HK97 family phage prohead protease n=1 Tax=Micromonospora sp. NPDC049580 TaxID=3154832 RepID=UPI0034494E7A
MITVDRFTRTLTALVVPYDQVGRGLRPRRYAPGSLRWTAARLPVLVEHVWSRQVGWVLDLRETAAGLLGTLWIARSLAGDRALAQVVNGTLRGLSPGADLVDAAPSPGERGVALIRAANLLEVSLTATPRFDVAGAR